METSKCNCCGADIIWTVTENGQKMPIDPKREKRVILIGRQRHQEPLAMERDTYLSHFVTCANAWEFHKARNIEHG